jgi:hypothetical protein
MTSRPVCGKPFFPGFEDFGFFPGFAVVDSVSFVAGAFGMIVFLENGIGG